MSYQLRGVSRCQKSVRSRAHDWGRELSRCGQENARMIRVETREEILTVTIRLSEKGRHTSG